jgi:AraC-like DNA-binding protein
LFFLLHPNAVQCWISHQEQRREKTKSSYLILNEHLTMLFQVLMEEMTTNEEPDAAVGKNLLSSFVSILLREISAGRVQPIMESVAKSSYLGITADATNDPDDFVSRLECYVQAKLHQPLTLEAVARDLFMSRTQFTRVVRQKTGKSFGALIKECRMERAKQLLLDSDWTVFAIGTFVGFKSPSYFNTLFREYTGQTPTQFRSLHQK